MVGSSSTTSTCGRVCGEEACGVVIAVSVLMAEESSQRRSCGVTAVILPAAQCKLQAIIEASNAQMSDRLPASAAEVLVIDDDAIMRELMADWLEAAGYQVRKA